MANSQSKRLKIALCIFSFIFLMYGGNVAAAEKCEVTAGPNKGKTGTFGNGKSWCEGSWGGTECKDQQGTDKCKAVELTVSGGDTGVFEGKAGTVIVTTGVYETAEKGLVRCMTFSPADSPATSVCSPVAVDNLEALMKSEEEATKRVAEAVKGAIRNIRPYGPGQKQSP
jgi:hypothetical protein